MNKTFKIIWSRVKNCWVVVSELAKSHTKSSRNNAFRKVLISCFLLTLFNHVPVYAAELVSGIPSNGSYVIDDFSSSDSSLNSIIRSAAPNTTNKSYPSGYINVGGVLRSYVSGTASGMGISDISYRVITDASTGTSDLYATITYSKNVQVYDDDNELLGSINVSDARYVKVSETDAAALGINFSSGLNEDAVNALIRAETRPSDNGNYVKYKNSI